MKVTLDWSEIRIRAAAFTNRWKSLKKDTQEIAEAQTFENEFFEVFGLDRRLVASFEKHVRQDPEGYDIFGNPICGNDSRIDCLWPGKLLIEMKKRGRDLSKAYKQALKYVHALTDPRDLPLCILICDFNSFEYHDLNHHDETGAAKVYAFTLDEFRDNVEIFAFMTGRTETTFKKTAPVDVEAAERMSLLHNALSEAGYTGRPLEVYLVRLLFCLFADDSGIFPQRKQFAQYIADFTKNDGSDLASAFETIFEVLNTPDGSTQSGANGQPSKRLKTLSDALNAFPYIDGHLFEERLPTAGFNSAMRNSLLECCALDWSKISPAVFGSMFQGVMKDELRHDIGAHYTSETNIMKIVSALFLDELKAEFEKLKKRAGASREGALETFHHKLARLRFFDPACGCGNFLVIAYRELRELEIEVIAEIEKDKPRALDITSLVWVNVDQFYGIELEEFPAEIAQTALWLVDHLENNKVSERFGNYYARIPLSKAANIHCANALETDWKDVLDPFQCSYILGNPPFLGARMMNPTQKAELNNVFDRMKGCNNLDYVTCWYRKAVDYMQGTHIQAAFVSTNSITQGQHVPLLWTTLFNKGLKINFAHQTFKWSNEAARGQGMAAVYCVIIGFALFDIPDKRLYSYADVTGDPVEATVKQINPYLLDAPQVFIEARNKPLCKVPEMVFGSMPNDGGGLIFTPEE
jgi:type I restriction-modification system DNA methylase subunit